MIPPPKPVNDPRNPARSDAAQTTIVNSIMFKRPLPLNKEFGTPGHQAIRGTVSLAADRAGERPASEVLD